jgi:hypothetical protein
MFPWGVILYLTLLEEAVQQASVEEAQAAEVRRRHTEAEEDNHHWVRQSCWSGTPAGQKTKGKE